MNTILITGANRGLGLEMARQYSLDGWHVIGCCRNIEQAHELRKISNTQILKLDVANAQSIKNLVNQVGNQPIDILMNNAGVWGPKNQGFGSIEPASLLETFKVNTVAPLLLAEALFKNIAASDIKIIANMSSIMSSMELNSNGGYYTYRSTKAALNAITKSMAIDLKAHQIKVIALHPGWVLTDMGGPNAQITPEESVKGIKKVLTNISLTDSGSFIGYDNNKLVW